MIKEIKQLCTPGEKVVESNVLHPPLVTVGTLQIGYLYTSFKLRQGTCRAYTLSRIL
jgi:hypothetical protein